jgi:hypothetical protein
MASLTDTGSSVREDCETVDGEEQEEMQRKQVDREIQMMPDKRSLLFVISAPRRPESRLLKLQCRC